MITLLVWCGPLLLFHARAFNWVRMPEPQPRIFTYLLGAAFLALVVGYWYGLPESKRGIFPRATVWMGMVSNGFASLLLFHSGTAGEWQDWGALAQAYLWGSAFVTLSIASALAYCLALMKTRLLYPRKNESSI